MGRAHLCTQGQVGLSQSQDSGRQATLRLYPLGILGGLVSKAWRGKKALLWCPVWAANL